MNSFLIVVLLLLSISSSTLADFRDGYIVTNEKDTIFGQVDYRSNAKNFKSCRFKMEDKIIEYSPQQIIGFGYKNDKYFTSSIIVDSFVEVLVDGEISLYKSNENFLLKKKDELYKLESKEIEVEIDGKKGFKEDTKWRGIINFLINECFSFFNNTATNIKLGEKSLTHLIIRYNECKGVDFIVYKNNKPWTKIDLGVSFGIANSTIKVNNQTVNYSFLDNSYNSIDPTIGLLFAVSSPRLSEKIAFQSEIHFIKSSYSSLVELNGSVYSEFYDTFIDLTTISFPISIKYSFPEKKYSFYVQAGFNFDYNIAANTKLQSEIIKNNIVNTLQEVSAFEINSSQIGYWGGFGVLKSYSRFKGSVSLRYFQMTNLNSSDNFSASNSRMILSLMIFRK